MIVGVTGIPSDIIALRNYDFDVAIVEPNYPCRWRCFCRARVHRHAGPAMTIHPQRSNASELLQSSPDGILGKGPAVNICHQFNRGLQRHLLLTFVKAQKISIDCTSLEKIAIFLAS